jgi:hypothetical protein
MLETVTCDLRVGFTTRLPTWCTVSIDERLLIKGRRGNVVTEPQPGAYLVGSGRDWLFVGCCGKRLASRAGGHAQVTLTAEHADTARTVRTPTGWRTRSTPVRIRLLAAVLIVLTLLAGLLAGLAASNRQSATTSAAQRAEPLLVAAQTISTSLSDADSTAAASFLRGRLEPNALHARYVSDLNRASTALAAASQGSGTDPMVQSPLRTLSVELPGYTGLVQTAIFNERQAFYPLAAAYLSEANNMMRTRILPAANALYTIEGTQLAGDEANAVNWWLAAAAIVCLVALLAVLVLAQWWMSGHFRRTLNVPLVVATVLTATLGLWFGVALFAQNAGVASATTQGSGPIDRYTQARILALEMRADDELTLLTLDSVPSYQKDYAATSHRLSGLLAATDANAGATQQSQLARAEKAFTTYNAVHKSIRSLDVQGHIDQAETLASGSGASDLPAVASQLDLVFTGAITDSQRNFDAAMSGSTGDLDGLLVAIGVLAVLSATLVFVGFRPRISEYR